MQQLREVWAGPGRRMLLYRWALCAMLLSQMALSYRLWGVPGRTFPAVPILLASPGPWLDAFLSALFVVSVLAVAFAPRRRGAVGLVIGLGLILVQFDIQRLQPWFFQELLLCTALFFEDDRAFGVAGFVVIATYVWSGLQKINLVFAGFVFPYLLRPLGLGTLAPLWPAAPAIEFAVGILLLFPRTRTVALIAISGMHAFLLVAIGPLGLDLNSVVWPWNFFLPLLAFSLFFRNRQAVFPGLGLHPWGKAIILLVGVLPLLNFFGVWDDYLSASLYSGKTREGFIVLTESGARMVPAKVRPYVQRRKDHIAIDLIRWSMADLNVPAYPEVRAYRGVMHQLNHSGIPAAEMKLVIIEHEGFSGKPRQYVASVVSP